MRKRGRKSSADLSVVPISVDTRRPEPPAELTKGQAVIWREIVQDLPGGWVTVAQEPLLAAYCRHVDTGDMLSKWIESLDFQTVDRAKLSRLLGMRSRETSAMMALATKMRLTQQSRMHPRTAGRAEHSHSHLWQRKPWEDD